MDVRETTFDIRRLIMAAWTLFLRSGGGGVDPRAAELFAYSSRESELSSNEPADVDRRVSFSDILLTTLTDRNEPACCFLPRDGK